MEDGEAAGGEQGRAGALQGAGGDEGGPVGGEGTQQRGEGEPGDADLEDAASSEAISEAAAEQEEAGEGEGVGVDDPLQGREVLAEFAPDGRQGDADDAGVEGGQSRAEDRGQQDPAAGATALGDTGGGRLGALHVVVTSR